MVSTLGVKTRLNVPNWYPAGVLCPATLIVAGSQRGPGGQAETFRAARILRRVRARVRRSGVLAVSRCSTNSPRNATITPPMAAIARTARKGIRTELSQGVHGTVPLYDLGQRSHNSRTTGDAPTQATSRQGKQRSGRRQKTAGQPELIAGDLSRIRYAATTRRLATVRQISSKHPNRRRLP